jgi:four helix bundle protein
MEVNLKSDLRYRTYNFSISVIRFIGELPEKKVFWVISDQLLRSSTSIGANIVEAKASSSRKEFIRYYQIALKSAHETNYWLSLLNDATEINKDKLLVLIKELDEIIKMLTASILTLKNKKF